MIYLYTKHPPHNLGGENYPNFRNSTDKDNYCKKFVSATEYGSEVYVERTSFDTAKIVINSGTPLFNVAGLQEFNKGYYFYWWIVNWESGAQAFSITYYLQLDYWLTYWPLAFNDSIVKIERRHAPRFLKQTDGSFNVAFNVKNGSPHLFVPENEQIAVDYPLTTFALEKWKHVNANYHFVQLVTVLFKGSYESWAWPTNFKGTIYNFNDATATNSVTGWAFINKYDRGELRLPPNSMLNHPDITNACWIWMDAENLVDYTDLIKKTPSNPTRLLPTYYKVNRTTEIDDVNTLGLVKIDFSPRDLSQLGTINVFYKIIDYLMNLIVYSWLTNTTLLEDQLKIDDRVGEVAYDTDITKYRISVNTDYRVGNVTKIRPLFSMLPFSDFFTSGFIETKGLNLFWGHESTTTIKSLNRYFNNNPIKIKLTFPFMKNTGGKFDNWDYKRELKVYTTHAKYFLIYQTQHWDFNPILLSTVDQFRVSVSYDWYYFAGINNLYIYFKPSNTPFSNDQQQRFNFLSVNQTKSQTFSSPSLNFYREQGASYLTGLEQAKWSVNFTKKYNQFRQNNAIANAMLGGIGGLLGGAGGGLAASKGIKEGKVGSGTLAGAGGGLGMIGGITKGIFGMEGAKLANEQALKQAKYGVKKLASSRIDALKQPTQTNAADNIELAFNLFRYGEPRVQSYLPAQQEFIALARFYHKNGHGGTSFGKVDLNGSTTRYYFNFWKISNIEQAIIKDTIPLMVVNHFNDLFNKGVRLWNVYNQGVVFNDYSKENWEIDYRAILRSNGN